MATGCDQRNTEETQALQATSGSEPRDRSVQSKARENMMMLEAKGDGTPLMKPWKRDAKHEKREGRKEGRTLGWTVIT